jgi:hypothetical protein
MKKSEANKVLAYVAPADSELTCLFSDESFEVQKGELAFSFNGNPISPSQARLQGFRLSDDITMPSGISNRRELSAWLQGPLNLERNSDKFRTLYSKFGSELPAGHEEFFNPKKYK